MDWIKLYLVHKIFAYDLLTIYLPYVFILLLTHLFTCLHRTLLCGLLTHVLNQVSFLRVLDLVGTDGGVGSRLSPRARVRGRYSREYRTRVP